MLVDFFKIEVLQKILYSSILLLIISNIFLFLLLLTQKIYIEQRNKKLKKLKEFYSNKILEIISGKDIKIKLNKKLDYQAFSEAASDILSTISIEFKNKIIEILNESGVIRYYLKKANSKNWLKRIEAIEMLGTFRINSLEENFFSLLKKEKKFYVKTQILQGLSLICSKNSLNSLIDEIKIGTFSGKFLELIFSNIIQALKQRNEETYFIEILQKIKNDETMPEEIKKSMIEACGTSILLASSNIILDYYETFQDNPYMKITCIRSLGKMSAPEVCDIIEKAFFDEKWEVRAIACKYAFLCPHLYSTLLKLLEDTNFYVRKNAVLAMAESSQGLKNLKEKLISTTDKYTKDLINSILRLRNA